jgi:phospholipase C
MKSTAVMPRLLGLTVVAIVAIILSGSTGGVGARPLEGPRAPATPIEHIVVIFQENQSFDGVLGYMCVEDSRCNGATEGQLHDGSVIPLTPAPDIVPAAAHGPKAQLTAFNGGLMNGYDLIDGCGPSDDYRCYTQYLTPQEGDPGSIPNLVALARQFVVSDRTYTSDFNASWAAHMSLVSVTNDGFTGDQPNPNPDFPDGRGWGCDSFMDANWISPTGDKMKVPSCVPRQDGFGPYRPSPVSWVPTIFGRLDDAGLPWHIYGRPTVEEDEGAADYTITVCPTFGECLYGPQQENVVVTDQIYTDAQNGTLPAFSIVVPKHDDSQHNQRSMLMGDNYIGRVVSDIMNGPNWDSTAIFITYDDCGCFYDHVPSPPGFGGIRVPMVIVSPYAKPGYTDSKLASFASILAFTERIFRLPPLAEDDATAYPYSKSFDFSQVPLSPIELTSHPVPAWELRYVAENPMNEEIDPDW